MNNNTRFDVYAPEIQRSLKLFVVLSRASRSLMDLAQLDIKRYGLNPSEFAVLELLFHKGPTPIQQIGSRILLASGTMTYVIDKLAAKGLIVRQSCESDRRVIYVQLTPDGEALMERIFPEHAQVLHDAIGTLSTDEQEKLVELLKKVGKGSVSPS